MITLVHDRVPFRMVDEINQGMDERNERMVFDRIVQSCCHDPSKGALQRPKPQYFLVTPKLLPGIRSMQHDDVTVLMVYNGPGLHFDWMRDNPIYAAAFAAHAAAKQAPSAMASSGANAMTSSSGYKYKDEFGKKVAETDSDKKKSQSAPLTKALPLSQAPEASKPQSSSIAIKRELISPDPKSASTIKSFFGVQSQPRAGSVTIKSEGRPVTSNKRHEVIEILDTDEEEEDLASKRPRREADTMKQKENLRANSSAQSSFRRSEVIVVD